MKNHHLFRIVLTKSIDRWFFEKGNRLRTHRRAYELFILLILGICKTSFHNYRHAPEELLNEFPIPLYLESVLWFSVIAVKLLAVAGANRFFVRFRRIVERTLVRIDREQCGNPLDADLLFEYLALEMQEAVHPPASDPQ